MMSLNQQFFHNMIWKHLPHTQKGTCFFDGRLDITDEVGVHVPIEEIQEIYRYVRNLANRSFGINHLQVFVHPKTKACLLMIDQLSWDMHTSGMFRAKKRNCSMMFDYEYCLKPDR